MNMELHLNFLLFRLGLGFWFCVYNYEEVEELEDELEDEVVVDDGCAGGGKGHVIQSTG